MEIRQAVLEIFNFTDQDFDNFPRKKRQKTENGVFRVVLYKLKNNRLCDVRNAKYTIKQ